MGWKMLLPGKGEMFKVNKGGVLMFLKYDPCTRARMTVTNTNATGTYRTLVYDIMNE